MKHSKLPWNLLSYPVAGQEEESCKILTPDSAWSVASGLSLDNGLFIVTACNEYDTLKAKAELFDEAVSLLDKAVSRIASDNHSTDERYYPYEVTVPISDLLSKAKELK